MCSICARSGELRGIRPSADGGVEIGALTTLRAIERSAFLRQHYPVLTEAAATVASPVLRNMGTIGGNICLDTRCLWYNQSLTWRKGCGFCIKKDGDLCHVAPGGTKCWAAFSGDTPPALLCLDAEIEIASPDWHAPYSAAPTSILVSATTIASCSRTNSSPAFSCPQASAGYRGVYRKLRVRGSIDYPAGRSRRRHEALQWTYRRRAHWNHRGESRATCWSKVRRNLLTGKVIDEALAEAAGDLAAKISKPLTTSALTPEYRREMIRVFTKRAVLAAAKRPRLVSELTTEQNDMSSYHIAQVNIGRVKSSG